MSSGEDTVLVVEDEEEARTTLMQILELEGFRTVGFSNGAEALEHLAQSERPCLIIMDIRMPVMDGRQFRSALLGDTRLAEIPVVIVTAMDPAAATGLAALRVFRKPVDLEALVGVIRRNC
jgi:CheY-like chemotaxis protein